jgi:hypothetical protein
MFSLTTLKYLNSFSVDKEKNVMLEPLSCLFRMILLNYKDNGVKISIEKNSIHFNDNSYYQGIIRTINGDTRDDLHNLYNPFLKCFEWYPSKNNKMMLYFYEKCKDGLEKLTNCYENGSIIHHTLSHYSLLFKNMINDQAIEKLDIKESPLLDEFKKIWKEDELIIIYKMLTYIENITDEDEKEVYLKSIDDIISMKERKVCEYIEKYSTSYN